MKVLPISINHLFFFFILAAVFASCADEGTSTESPRTFIPEAQEIITTTLHGRIIDKNEAPIEGAIVHYKSGTSFMEATTDEYGSFLLQNVPNKGSAAFISVTASGKHEAFRKFSVLPNRFNYTEVKMNDFNISGVIDANDGGKVALSDGSSVTLPANGIVDDNGNPYTGAVSVALAWINPTSPLLSSEMVGDLSGFDDEGNIVALTTYGMLQVELRSQDNRELNLAVGQEATLFFPLPSTIRSSAPEIIPLWSYDEVNGIWIEEGRAVKKQTGYEGEVSHFSSWNVDAKGPVIEIKGKVVLEDKTESKNFPASYLKVYVCIDGLNRKGGWLCEDGSFRFYNFPAGQKFDLKILDKCGEEVFKESYGPFTSDEVLEDIIVEETSNITQISGNLLTCDGSPVVNGSINIVQNDLVRSFPLDKDGFFDFGYDFCSGTEAKVFGIDVDNALIEDQAISSTSNTTLNDWKLCSELEQFIQVNLEGKEPLLFIENISYKEYGDEIILVDSSRFNGLTNIIVASGMPGTADAFEPFVLSISDKVEEPGTYQALLAVFQEGQFGCLSETFVDVIITVKNDSQVIGKIEPVIIGCADTNGGFEDKEVSVSFQINIDQ